MKEKFPFLLIWAAVLLPFIKDFHFPTISNEKNGIKKPIISKLFVVDNLSSSLYGNLLNIFHFTTIQMKKIPFIKTFHLKEMLLERNVI